MTFDGANEFIAARIPQTTSLSSRAISASIPPRVRAHCFFSARVAERRVLEKIKELADRHARGLVDQGEARRELRLWLRSEGFDDGRASVANLASKARTELILNQNRRMAYAAGRWRADRDPAVEARFPSWKYHCGRNPRPDHKALDGKVFLKSDPIWSKIFPPWEFNCNCWVENSAEIPSGAARIDPPEPESGFRFDPMELFDDWTQDAADASVARRAREIEEDEIRRIWRGSEEAQPGIAVEANRAWTSLPKSERDAVADAARRGSFELRPAESAPERGAEKTGEFLPSAPRWKGAAIRAIALPSEDALRKALADLESGSLALRSIGTASISLPRARSSVPASAPSVLVLHVVRQSGAAFVGTRTDADLAFAPGTRFRALKRGEEGFFPPRRDADGLHVAAAEA